MREGLIVESRGRDFLVRTEGALWQARLRKRWQDTLAITNPVAVGDRVSCTPDTEAGRGFIEAVLPRSNQLRRTLTQQPLKTQIIAANIHCIYLIATLTQPYTPLVFIDKILAQSAWEGIPVCLVFNKTDVYKPKDLQKCRRLRQLYEQIGYRVHICCFTEGQLPPLPCAEGHHMVLLIGYSGVGKSSLIQALGAQEYIKIQPVSTYNDRGRHTTAFTKSYQVAESISLIDTPGLNDFSPYYPAKEGYTLSDAFQEFRFFLQDCRFRNCTHTHESDCAVRVAVAAQNIALSRYESYLSLLSERAAAIAGRRGRSTP